MGLATQMMKEVADLIRLGFPESTATKIASGELPMDTASRMQRAEEQGYDVDTPVYHGTDADFDEFDPERAVGSQFWSTTNKAAVESGEVGAAGHGVIKELLHRINNPADWDDYDNLLLDEIIGRGYDGLKLPDPDGNSVMVAFEPEQYKSVDAAFDPDYKGSNLLGEYALPAGSTALMASLLAAPEEAEAGPLAKVISKTINRQDDANLPWSSEAQYTHDQSGGFMRLGVYPDGRVSTLELEVPEEFRRRGIGGELQESALRDYPEMQGQVSSKSALRNAYRLGRRPVEEPNATLERALEMQSQASSVNMKRPTSGERGAATPGMMALLAAGGAGATAAGSESNAVTEATSRIVNHMLDNVTEVTDLLEIPQRGIQGLLRAGYGLMQGDGLDASLNAGADVVNQGVEETAKQAGDAMLEKTGNPELAAMAYTAVMLGSPL